MLNSMDYKVISAAIVAVLGCIAVYSQAISWLILLPLCTILAVALGVLFVIWMHVILSLPHKTGSDLEHVQKYMDLFRGKIMHYYDLSPKATQDHMSVVFGRTLDNVLQQLIGYFTRDYINYYLQHYAYNSSSICENIKEDIWDAIHHFYNCLSRVDHVSLIAEDMVSQMTVHFEKIREAKALVAESHHEPLFKLAPYLMDEESEINYLRQISELYIIFLLPRSYSLPPAKYFLREILACKVFYEMINVITDPDFFNRHVINYIEAQKTSSLKKSFELDDFLKMIHKSDDVETLKRFRIDLMKKIMDATTLLNMKQAKGIDPDGDKPPTGVSKSELAESKSLKRYIDQLQTTKKECDKRLKELGWDAGMQYQVLPLNSVLEHVLGRKYLSMFLETMASQCLVGYWTMVEELKVAHRKNWHQIGAEIFYTYVRNPQTEIKIDKSVRKRMEAFLLGDKGPEVFYEVQTQVLKTIEEKYYQSFVNSEQYADMVSAIDNDEVTEIDSSCQFTKINNLSDNVPNVENVHVVEHSMYSRRKLNELQEKLNNKTQALEALKRSLKPESRVLKMLEKEVEWLEGEKRQLEAHLIRTEIWGENLGRWKAVVQSAEIPEEKEPPTFVIVVHKIESEADDEEEEQSSGWVVSRSLIQFQELHKKLRPLCSDIKTVELPSQPLKFLFGKNDRTLLDKAKIQIQKYLDFVLKDDKLNQSEAIYSFLSPSSEHLKYVAQAPKKSKFSFSTLFKSNSEPITRTFRESEDSADISYYLDTPGGQDSGDKHTKNFNGTRSLDDSSKDAIAEPLYSLMSEIFDDRGLMKYLRKTLIAFVQITYGRTINRQIYDTINWYFSEKMLHWYATSLMKSFWPHGELAGPGPVRTDGEKLATANEARKLFVENVPEILITLVGERAAKNGARKIFDTLQSKKMNKQLFYNLFEIFMIKVFPELNIEK